MQHRPLSPPSRSDSLPKSFGRSGSIPLRQRSSKTPRRRTACSLGVLLVGTAIVWILLTLLRPGLLKVADTYSRRHIYYQGRFQDKAPSPKCCHAEGCLETDKGRYAVVTTLRSNAYIPLIEELSCSLKRTNPHLRLIIYTVPGDLDTVVLRHAGDLGEIRYWDDLRFPSNSLDGRFELNWVKLRAWTLEEFDAVLLLDSDVTVVGNVTPVFTLPTAFAAVGEQDQGVISYWFSSLGRIQGGVLMVRPCKAVFDHMVSLLHKDKLLQYRNHFAEQDFLDWYFKFDRMMLPLEYNTVPEQGATHKETLGGNPLKIIHFTRNKPFFRDPSVPLHSLLTCAKAKESTKKVHG